MYNRETIYVSRFNYFNFLPFNAQKDSGAPFTEISIIF